MKCALQNIYVNENFGNKMMKLKKHEFAAQKAVDSIATFLVINGLYLIMIDYKNQTRIYQL
jgi:hypothetical protein